MQETEITVQVLCTEEELKQILLSAGYEITSTYTLHDHYFTSLPHPIIGLDFKTLIASSFLVREIEENNESETHLVFKNKIFDKSGKTVLTEEKIKTSLGNREKALSIFEKAGFLPYASIVNHSTNFKSGEIDIAVQRVDGLGLFIELEQLPSQKGKTEQTIIAELKQILIDLRLPLGNNFACQKLWMKLNS